MFSCNKVFKFKKLKKNVYVVEFIFKNTFIYTYFVGVVLDLVKLGLYSEAKSVFISSLRYVSKWANKLYEM